jgi:hypothetical protein
VTKADAERLKAAKVPTAALKALWHSCLAAPLVLRCSWQVNPELCLPVFLSRLTCASWPQLAPGRLANVADTVDGVLDPARYLKQGRHGDWTPVSGACASLPACSTSDVTVTIAKSAATASAQRASDLTVSARPAAAGVRAGWLRARRGQLRGIQHGDARELECALLAGSGPRAGPSWGVTSLPPGAELLDPRVRDAIQAQQRR